MCDKCGQPTDLSYLSNAIHEAWVSAKALALMMDFRGGADVPVEVSGFLADTLVDRLEEVEKLIDEAAQHPEVVS